jgi:uncharacterized protein (TIGR03083 family)
MDLTAIRAAIIDLDRAFYADMQALPSGVWNQPSDCAGWTIAAAVIHVAQVAELLGDSVARGRMGDPGPPPLAAAEGVHAWRAARTERQQLALTQTPEELLAWYRQATDAIHAELELIPSAPVDSEGWHPVGARPLSWVQDQWLFELALHDWDIRVALDPAAEIRTETQAAFARTLPGRLGRGFSGADNPALAGTYEVQMQASEPLTITIAVGGGSVDIVEGAGAPDVIIVTDPSAFGLVVTNRRQLERFSEAGRWQVIGDADRAEGFARAFTSY